VVLRGRSGTTCESLDNSEREEPYGSLKKKKIALTVDLARKLQTTVLGAPVKRTDSNPGASRRTPSTTPRQRQRGPKKNQEHHQEPKQAWKYAELPASMLKSLLAVREKMAIAGPGLVSRVNAIF
jgi:hypothetical protein